jgi:hypothetical protein
MSFSSDWSFVADSPEEEAEVATFGSAIRKITKVEQRAPAP